MPARLSLCLVAALLGGCTTTLELPPGGQMSAVANPHCALICTVRLSTIDGKISGDGAQTITASPSFSVSQGGPSLGAGHDSPSSAAAPPPMVFVPHSD